MCGAIIKMGMDAGLVRRPSNGSGKISYQCLSLLADVTGRVVIGEEQIEKGWGESCRFDGESGFRAGIDDFGSKKKI